MAGSFELTAQWTAGPGQRELRLTASHGVAATPVTLVGTGTGSLPVTVGFSLGSAGGSARAHHLYLAAWVGDYGADQKASMRPR